MTNHSRLFLPSLSRRRILGAGAGGIAGALLARWLRPLDAFAAAPPAGAPATACVVIWLNGGPSHIDTFDPKPGQPTGGKFKAIKTRAKGVEISEHFPRLAEQAGHVAFLRGMTSKEGNHQRARYLMHTGYAPNPTVIHPSLGGWMSEEKGDRESELPSFVSINGPSMGAGFLGVQHGPFVIAKAGQPPQNIALGRTIDETRFAARRAALDAMEAQFEAETGDGLVKGRRAVYAQTVRMMKSPKLAAFDLAEEPEAMKKLYGDSDFGRGCLVARRLLEKGVKLIEIVLDGWDTHQDNFTKVQALSEKLDGGMAGLLKDLNDRRTLKNTLVVCMGDFGRTPKINENDGRDHYPKAWSALLAGGGIRGGIAHGKTDAAGANVVEGAVAVNDLFATIVTQLGMDPGKGFGTPSGRPISITESGAPIKALLG